VTHLHPPFDLPIYGLDDTWDGPRWLEFLDGQAGHPLRGVWLGHGRDVAPVPGRDWAFVGSFPLERAGLSQGETFERGLAFDTARILLDATKDVPRMKMEADRWESWPTVSWRVDGQEVVARLLAEAGPAWSAFTTDLPHAGVVIRGSGLGPDGVSLVRVDDSSRYHFDAELPLEYPTVMEASRAAALGR
jgi:hypothetical protein